MCYGEKEVIAQLAAMIEQEIYRQREAEKQRRKIPVIIEEYLETNNATSLPLKATSHNLFKVTSLIVYSQYVGSGGYATLTLGDRVIPVGQGLTVINGITLLLRERDKRQLDSNSATAGQMYLHLMGDNMADIVKLD